MDYITITINTDFLETVFIIFFSILVLVIIFNLIDIIVNEKKRYKDRKRRLEAMPYKKQYDKLISEGKHKEALEFSKKYDKYLKEVYYYW